MYDIEDFNKDEWKSTKISKIDTRIINCASDVKLPECYSIFVETYEYKDKSKHYWNQLKYYIKKNDKTILTFNRNYFGEAPLSYIKDKDSGKEYILTSGDYQCFTIVNLSDLKITSHCLGNHNIGCGFCPTDIYSSYNEDNKLYIRVEGCYWGCPFEFFYLEDPDLDNFEFPENITLFEVDPEDDD